MVRGLAARGSNIFSLTTYNAPNFSDRRSAARTECQSRFPFSICTTTTTHDKWINGAADSALQQGTENGSNCMRNWRDAGTQCHKKRQCTNFKKQFITLFTRVMSSCHNQYVYISEI